MKTYESPARECKYAIAITHIEIWAMAPHSLTMKLFVRIMSLSQASHQHEARVLASSAISSLIIPYVKYVKYA